MQTYIKLTPHVLKGSRPCRRPQNKQITDIEPWMYRICWPNQLSWEHSQHFLIPFLMRTLPTFLYTILLLCAPPVVIHTLIHVRDSLLCRTTYIEYKSQGEDSSIFWGTPPNSIGFHCQIDFIILLRGQSWGYVPFRAKGLRWTPQNRNFTSVFDVQRPFRAKGLRWTPQNRKFT